MAKYAISKEGVSQLQKLSKSIISDTENIYEAGIALKNNISSLGEGLGLYEDEIINLVNHNQSELQSNKEAFRQLSQTLSKKADEICSLMGFSSVGGTGSVNTNGKYTANRTCSGDFAERTLTRTTSGLPYASTLDRPKVLKRDENEAITLGLQDIDKYMDVLRDDLCDKGITDPTVVNAILKEKRDVAECRLYNDVYGDVQERCQESLMRLSAYFSEENWGKMDVEEKKDALNTLAVDAGKAFRSEVQGVKYFNGNSNSRGYYNGDGYLYLNFDVLTDNNNRLDAIDTIFHEGRHAFQHSASTNPNRCSIDNDTARLWGHNLKRENYIRYEQNPLKYFNQPVEVDARTFAESVMSNGGVV